MDELTGTRHYGPARCVLSIPFSLPPKIRERVRELSQFIVPKLDRKQGLAGALLEHVTAEADKAGMVLMLIAEPYDAITDLDRLIALYERYGFVRIQTNPVPLMARQPISIGVH